MFRPIRSRLRFLCRARTSVASIAVTLPACGADPEEDRHERVFSVGWPSWSVPVLMTASEKWPRVPKGRIMKAFRRAACILLAAICFVASPAYPTAFTTDSSDLWYIVAESGWGMQLVQRGDIIFATLFVYDPSGAPTWYVATLAPTVTPLVWSGDLLATTGPWFGTVP